MLMFDYRDNCCVAWGIGTRCGGLYILSAFRLHQSHLPGRMSSHVSQDFSRATLLSWLLWSRLPRLSTVLFLPRDATHSLGMPCTASHPSVCPSV